MCNNLFHSLWGSPLKFWLKSWDDCMLMIFFVFLWEQLYSTANDPETANDPQNGPQMILDRK